MTSQLDTTIAAFEKGLTDFSAAKGAKSIDTWLKTLEKADFHGAKIIHENLSKLKTHLEADEIDVPAIGELLRNLAEETGRTASQADGAVGEKILQLAGLLSQVGSDLSR
ncbi:hypothetical protein E7T06_18835 [Deinococcus sp. Arct2-2]|uniref:hypothetical protein n=1 Tax=Deinococcus sp. Arct2-2 TaxID=2568653 RepID=UPI0010A33FF2|nr:hypothetical protein [Deinococcus sp. Arct2-2]THF67932.1 hypothetical protein E7T06_18835 [Deinococcus sp. Arct2-2]